MKKNFRKRSIDVVTEEDPDSDQERRQSQAALEEIKFLQRQRERKSGIPALPPPSTTNNNTNSLLNNNENKGGGGEADGDNKDELVLQDTFAQETAVMVEDPNMLRYVEHELAKKRGNNMPTDDDHAENEVNRAEDELYKIPDHLKVKRRNAEESSTQWTTGIAEIQLPIEYKLKNIEETEAAKKLLQEKRLAGRAKTESVIPSSFSADFSQRGKDYAERLRKDHTEPYKEKGGDGNGREPKNPDSATEPAVRRQAATDEIMLDRFRKRERQRVTRR